MTLNKLNKIYSRHTFSQSVLLSYSRVPDLFFPATDASDDAMVTRRALKGDRNDLEHLLMAALGIIKMSVLF